MKVWLIMADDLDFVPEHYVTDPDGSGLLFPISGKGVSTAAHCGKEGATYEPSPGLLTWEDGYLESVL